MLSLPIVFISVIGIFVPVFSRPVCQHVIVLLTGAVLAPGKRTVTAILQIMGRSAASDFQTYHRVLNRAIWLPLTASRLLLRLDAALYDPAPHRTPGTNGRPRRTGKRRPILEAVLIDERTAWTTLLVAQWYGAGPRKVEVATDTAVWYHTRKPPVTIRWVLMRDPNKAFKPQALLSTNLAHTPEQMLTWFVRRWTMAVTCAEARTHLGMETQRQWHDRAIARTTPALLSLYSIITLTAPRLIEQGATCMRSTAWYRKTRPTFSDAMALVRRHVWDHLHFSMSHQETDMIKIPRELFERFIDAVCDAA